ncbi:hypothetical protein NMY22_g7823 [Coprinellus aureogranulatus]|nr:hypothetical protein NMY22_g7823 [Coprinellus aureogranulatus]
MLGKRTAAAKTRSGRIPYSTATPPKPPPEKEESLSELQASLAGTVQAHRCLVLLNSSLPITEFPSRYSTKLQRELQLRLIRLGGLVNFAWFGEPERGEAAAGAEEVVSGVAYTPTGGRLVLPHISHSNVDTVLEQLTAHMEATSLRPETHDHIDILVCTHGARDCRCGERGGKVYQALREEVTKMRLEEQGLPKVRIGEVAHVGGHKYAANVLIYPHGEWLGLIKPEDVPTILRKVVPSSSSSKRESIRPLGRNDPLIIPERWRGRMGPGKDEQLEMIQASKKNGASDQQVLTAQLAKVKESFALYLRICALHRGNPHPHIPILENAWPYFNEKLKGNHPVDIEREIRGAIVTELDKYTKFIPVLNSVVPDQIIPWGSPAFRDVSQKGLKEAFDLINDAEVKLNTIKANQLRRLAGILERYPNYVRTCCEKGSEGTGAQKQSHRVAYLRTQADNMLMRQILDGRFVARAIFAQEQFYLVPYNRVLRLFMKVLCRFPPEDVKPPVQEQPRKTDDSEDEDEEMDQSEADEDKPAEPKPRRAKPPSKPKAPHRYPDCLQMVLDGLAQYHPVGGSQRTPPPRVMHTEYSLPKHQGYGGPAQPHFFLYNFHPTPREMNKWEGIWPFPEKEFEWLEGFLSICEYMSTMKEEWSVGRSVGDYWKQHVGEPR